MVGECGSEGTHETLRMRPVRSYASRKVMDPRVHHMERLAQSTASKRAPVLHQRASHVAFDSWHAVMRVARAGTRSSFNSSLVRVATSPATSAPPLVPVITSGRRSASRRALTTPKW